METVEATAREQAQLLLKELGLTPVDAPGIRAVSEHSASVPIPCDGPNGEPFLLKFFIVPAEGRFYPPEVRIEDYARRESAFYRYLDSSDPNRNMLPAPRVVLVDPQDPSRWILLERITGAVGPAEEVLDQDSLFELLEKLKQVPTDRLMGRRDFPLNHWDPVSYLDRVRMMYDPVLYVIGEKRWTRVLAFFKEALHWTDNRRAVFVHGDFTEQNIVVDQDGRPYLTDFERVGIGNEDHDFAWFWIHCTRDQAWKRAILYRWFGNRVGSARIRSEWGIRATLVYLALRRLRFGYLAAGDEDPRQTANLALLDAAIEGSSALFPQ